jgi:hypothetical protein
MSTNPVVNELLSLYAKLTAEANEMKTRHERELSELSRKLQAVELTVRLYSDGKEVPIIGRGKVSAEDIKNARTIKDALIRIAELNGGTLRITEAKQLILAAQKWKGKPKNVGPALYHMASEDDRFERIEPGIFRLNRNGLSPSAQPPLILVR